MTSSVDDVMTVEIFLFRNFHLATYQGVQQKLSLKIWIGECERFRSQICPQQTCAENFGLEAEAS